LTLFFLYTRSLLPSYSSYDAVLERTNAREIDASVVGCSPDLVVCDASFIPLHKVCLCVYMFTCVCVCVCVCVCLRICLSFIHLVYYSVKRDLLQCQKRPITVSADMSVFHPSCLSLSLPMHAHTNSLAREDATALLSVSLSLSLSLCLSVCVCHAHACLNARMHVRTHALTGAPGKSVSMPHTRSPLTLFCLYTRSLLTLFFLYTRSLLTLFFLYTRSLLTLFFLYTRSLLTLFFPLY
jgi:hypothetical protein